MPSIVIELTNHCNLSCQHCMEGRHSSDGQSLKLEILDKILQNCKEHGFDHLSFTGGEPTLHPRFNEILKNVYEAGYNFGFVTNGWNFVEMYSQLLPYRDRLRGITFSLDSAREEVHDRVRGRGAYRRLMKAFSICMVKDIPFTINTTVMSYNKGELKEMAELATKLGSRGLRFCHLMPTPGNVEKGLSLSPEECVVIEGIIGELQQSFPMPIIMAPGYHTTNLFPCSPLQSKELNIDWRGNVTLCCHLSGYGNGAIEGDIIGNLDTMSFAEAQKGFIHLNKTFHQDKRERYGKGEFRDSDYFPCFYCLNYFDKVDWLKDDHESPWSSLVWKV
ncbi:MAG: radical SAM protein [Candidatus Scalindua sp. AMX11]|nr:MAG: radical SAM protein [Candidatus Scalindua sp.]NOG84545.1 radical SAM protein [Planctomycetota bacterium]RZV92322.1 MAG: radical SAM protein [Candidatus Scalindua sp. SCAELEC01]TDE66154.1 MAG: radical SAM protein [Candidatus Scalindua sp. AMX11]GJQ59129.1 MAG: hypothetical protein SCALA701_19300 [Candidatus Scalindua sp.]